MAGRPGYAWGAASMLRGTRRARAEQPTIIFRLMFASVFLVFSSEKIAYQNASTPALAMRGDRLAVLAAKAPTRPRDVTVVTATDPIETGSVPPRSLQKRQPHREGRPARRPLAPGDQRRRRHEVALFAPAETTTSRATPSSCRRPAPIAAASLPPSKPATAVAKIETSR